MENLPQEIVINILSRLPVASLMNVKSVCRLWRNLIKDPVLLNMHLSRVFSENDLSLVLRSNVPTQSQLYYLQFSAHISDAIKRIILPTIPEFHVVGSCNGLLCLRDSQQKNAVYLYNPLAKKFIELPKAEQVCKEGVAIGFGYHPTTKEYKVVRILYYYRREDGDISQGRFPLPRSEVEIFNIGSCNWRSIGQASYQVERRPSHVLVNGRLHWLTWSHWQLPLRKIISFDLADEKFRQVPEPHCVRYGPYGKRCSVLVVLGGCLATVIYDGNSELDIRIMKEYDVKNSWIKAFRIGVSYLPKELNETDSSSRIYLCPAYARVLCLLKNGEILLEYERKTLVTYEPNSRTFKQIMFPGLPNWIELIVHVGSLNWIDNIIDM